MILTFIIKYIKCSFKKCEDKNENDANEWIIRSSNRVYFFAAASSSSSDEIHCFFCAAQSLLIIKDAMNLNCYCLILRKSFVARLFAELLLVKAGKGIFSWVNGLLGLIWHDAEYSFLYR